MRDELNTLKMEEKILEKGAKKNNGKGEPQNIKSKSGGSSEPEWDFMLPVIPLPSTNIGPGMTDYDTFNLRDTVEAIQNKAN